MKKLILLLLLLPLVSVAQLIPQQKQVVKTNTFYDIVKGTTYNEPFEFNIGPKEVRMKGRSYEHIFYVDSITTLPTEFMDGELLFILQYTFTEKYNEVAGMVVMKLGYEIRLTTGIIKIEQHKIDTTLYAPFFYGQQFFYNKE